MTRIVVIFSFFFAAACDVGSIQQAGTGVDGGTGSGSGSNGVVCENVVTANLQDGHHNPGLSCIAAGCHLEGNLGANAPAYSYAGTLYKEAAGTTPYAGATIFAKLGAVEKKVVTATNGNFWLTPDVAGLAAPTNAMTGTTKVSGCPTTTPMVTPLVQGSGNCNNCHRTGGTTTPVYLTP